MDKLAGAIERLLERGKKELGRAADSGRKRLELRQASRELQAFWVRLGKTAYRLQESGEIDHPALRKAMARIDALKERIDAYQHALPSEDAGGEE